MPESPCSASFRRDHFMPADDVFAALQVEGFRLEHIHCLQRKPSGKIFVTFRNAELRNEFVKKSSLVYRHRHFLPNIAGGSVRSPK